MAVRQTDQLIGLAQGILADGIVSQPEAELLKDWLLINRNTNNPYICQLLDQVEQILRDGVLDEYERDELHDALMAWAGGCFAVGRERLTASYPLDPEPRIVKCRGRLFVFTGTAAYGTRREMKKATEEMGGEVKRDVTLRTNFVVLGSYVTPAWKHETFGNKILKAMKYRDDRQTGIRIVHEDDWVKALSA